MPDATPSDIEEISKQAARAVYLGNNALLTVVLGRYKLLVDSTDRSLAPHLALDGYWESDITSWVARNTLSSDVAINVGANCGYYTILLGAIAAKVVAIEPSPTHVRNLRESLSLNGMTGISSVIEGVASDSSGERLFAFRTDGYTGSNAMATSAEPNATAVKSFRCDEICPDGTLLFVDAEGHEREVWRGAKGLHKNKGFRAVIEWSPERYDDPRGFYQEILADGFRCSVINGDGEEDSAIEQELVSGPWRMLVIRKK